MRYLAITFITLFITNLNTSGQSSEETTNHSGELSLRIKNINFVKNNEYFNPVIEGYTLLGFFFQPELVYTPSDKITLRAGAHLLKYSGADKFSQIRPVFSTSLNLSEKTILTLGSLSGSDSHHMLDPHFNSERLYSAYVEDGFQLTSSTDHFFNDLWLSWENFIFKGDNTREVFTFGESFNYTSSSVADVLQFEVPLQVQFKHLGGQISNYPEQVETFFNLATGLKINIDIQHREYGQASIEYLQFINKELNGEPLSGISSGHASWLRLNYIFKSLDIGATYWRAHNFYAPNGNTLFGSVSDYQINVVVPERKLITNHIYFTLLPESYLKLFLGLNTYYNIDTKRLDNSIALHLSFDKLIRLATLKN